MTKVLHIDFETKSALELSDVGIHNYASSKTTSVLMLAWACNDEEPLLWEPHLGEMPAKLRNRLNDPDWTKAAWNSGFERLILRYQLGIDIPIAQWQDPMINARYLSMPGSLESVGEILDIDYKYRKDKRGSQLLKLFSSPLPKKKKKKASNENTLFDISPIESEADYTFADHTTHPEEWAALREYCKQDIVAERILGDMMAHFPLPEREIQIWQLDQKINDAGFPTDRPFVEAALDLAIQDKTLQSENLKKMTGLENANSNQQFLKWVQAEGYPYNSLRKEPVGVALNDPEVKITDLGRKALEVRKKSSKTSYTKLAAIIPALSADDRLRDQFLFMGSARCGRWSGKAVQLHNMARPIKAVEELEDLEHARKFILDRNFDGLIKHFVDKKTGESGSALDIITSLIRSSFAAEKEKRFVISDLSSIENIVLGWVTGEDKILDVFKQKRDAYLSFASLMYKIPYEVLAATKKTPETKEKRQVAKPAVLGAGYRLSGGKWGVNKYGDRVKTGLWGYAEAMGVKISQELAIESVKAFRSEYKKVVSFWYDSENAIIRCIKQGGAHQIGPTGLVWCDRRKRKDGSVILRIHLPSGRYLHYLNAGVRVKHFDGDEGSSGYDKETFTYDGISQETKTWGPIDSHGGKITENCVQAISRDILAHGMLLADDLGMSIVAHVHDEIVCHEDDTDGGFVVEDLKWCMEQVPDWSPGLVLGAAGFESLYYRKG